LFDGCGLRDVFSESDERGDYWSVGGDSDGHDQCGVDVSEGTARADGTQQWSDAGVAGAAGCAGTGDDAAAENIAGRVGGVCVDGCSSTERMQQWIGIEWKRQQWKYAFGNAAGDDYGNCCRGDADGDGVGEYSVETRSSG